MPGPNALLEAGERALYTFKEGNAGRWYFGISKDVSNGSTPAHQDPTDDNHKWIIYQWVCVPEMSPRKGLVVVRHAEHVGLDYGGNPQAFNVLTTTTPPDNVTTRVIKETWGAELHVLLHLKDKEWTEFQKEHLEAFYNYETYKEKKDIPNGREFILVGLIPGFDGIEPPTPRRGYS